MKSTKIILAALIAFAVSLTASATLMVDFDATTTVDTDGVGYASAPDNVPFSDTVARSPGIGVNGYGNSPDTSATFYGGVDHSGSGGINDVPYLESTDGSFRYRLGAGIGDTMGALMLWNKVDFLSAGTVALGAGSSFTVNTDLFSSGIGGEEIRFVVEEGGLMYISSSVSALLDGDVDSTLINPGTASWFAYDPATNMLAIGASALPALSDITAAGVYIELTAEDVGNKTLAINSFTVDAVPEPATIGMLGLGAISLLVLRRKLRA